jgi:acyl dehydratase
MLSPVAIALTRQDVARYAAASGDSNPIHLDAQAAREAGLPGVVAHGMLTMGQAIRPLIEWAGGDPGAIREYTVRFGRPVVVPAQGAAELTVTGRAAAVTDGAVTVNLTVTVDGEKVLGKAQAKVVRSSPPEPARGSG